MTRYAFDTEKRQEAQRIERLRSLVDKVERPEFWDRLSQAEGAQLEGADSFREAIELRAQAMGVAPETLLSEYARQLRESTYPTQDCLEADAVQRIAASPNATPEPATHLQSCPACQQLVAACKQSKEERERLLEIVREAAAEGAGQQVETASNSAWTAG
jgi:hypothetical protein